MTHYQGFIQGLGEKLRPPYSPLLLSPSNKFVVGLYYKLGMGHYIHKLCITFAI